MNHVIEKPDPFAGGERRRIVWDDQTGDISGDHSDVPFLREQMARAVRDGYLPAMCGHWPLRDPRRDPRDFLVVLIWTGRYDVDWLPPSLRDVAPTPFVPDEIPEGAVA